MAVQDYIDSEVFVYPEVPDSLNLNIAEETAVIQISRQEGLLRQEGPESGLKPLIILILGFIIFSFVFGSGRSLFLHSLKDLFAYRERSSIFVESDVRMYHYQKLLFVFGFICCLLLLSLIFQQAEPAALTRLDGKSLLYSSLLLGAFLLVKTLLYWFFTLFQFDASTARQWKNDNILLFIVLSLLYAALIFVNEMVFIRIEHLLLMALILWLLIKSILFAKTVHYFSKQRLSWFHLILYLCALEILPVCVLYKGIIWIREVI